MNSHGTRSMYVNAKCRCEQCKQANSRYMSDYAWVRDAKSSMERDAFRIWLKLAPILEPAPV